ncbi:MAG: enoyl-CoA hydratase/isomerase family protein [Dehalococcoidia bacterium]|nr:enoyl-CoA hydratase/isomerase family protein [Dehalococcoidia bacterium]
MDVTAVNGFELVETIYEKRGRVAYITLNREQAGHAFNYQMCQEMLHIWEDVKDDPEVWVAIVSATGEKFFCTGVDVKEARERRLGDAWLPIARLMEEVHKPIICAVNGMCCGGGLHWVCDSDIIIGTENAQFFDSHVNVGMISGWEPVGLSRRIPLNYVLRMVIEGKSYRINADEAYRIGLITEIVPAAKLMERAEEIAANVLANSPLAVRYSKKAIMRGLDMGLRDGLDLAGHMLNQIWDTEDAAEGKQAFAERRQPVWKGR